MIRVAHTGDIHLTDGPRFDSTLRCLRHIVADGIQQGVNLWLVGGDMAGTTVPHKQTPRERNALVEILQGMADHAPVVMAYGNHDFPGDLDVFAELRAVHPIFVLDRPEAISVWDDALGLGRGTPARVYVLPYPSKRSYLAAVGAGAGVEDQNADYQHGLRTILAEWRMDREEHATLPAILLGHINIGGSRVAGGEVLIGQEIELAPVDLDTVGFDYVALSHIHLHQQVAAKAWFAGSPDRSNFGEEDEKGYIIAEVEAGQMPRIIRRLTPAQRLTTIRARWDAEKGWTDRSGATLAPPAELAGAEVRLVLEIDEDQRSVADVASLEAAVAAAGADAVKVDRRIQPKITVRSETIQQARTIAEKLDAWAASLAKGSVTPEQLARLHVRLGDLQAVPQQQEERTAA